MHNIQVSVHISKIEECFVKGQLTIYGIVGVHKKCVQETLIEFEGQRELLHHLQVTYNITWFPATDISQHSAGNLIPGACSVHHLYLMNAGVAWKQGYMSHMTGM